MERSETHQYLRTALQNIDQVPVRSAQFDPFTLTQPASQASWIELEQAIRKFNEEVEVKRYRMMIRALLHPILHAQGKPAVQRQESGGVRIYPTGEIRKK